jgi:hypothetical protein
MIKTVINHPTQKIYPTFTSRKTENSSKIFNHIITLAKDIDKKEGMVHTHDSLLNKIYQKIHPRLSGIAVYGSANPPKDPELFREGEWLGEKLSEVINPNTERPFHIICGGSGHKGNAFMQSLAVGLAKNGGHAISCFMNIKDKKFESSPAFAEAYRHKDFVSQIYHPRSGFDARSAYSIALPCGPGSFREILNKAGDLYYNRTKQPCQKQIILYDYKNYFSKPGGFISFLNQQYDDGFIKNRDFIDMFTLAKTPDEVIKALLSNKPWTGTHDSASK